MGVFVFNQTIRWTMKYRSFFSLPNCITFSNWIGSINKTNNKTINTLVFLCRKWLFNKSNTIIRMELFLQFWDVSLSHSIRWSKNTKKKEKLKKMVREKNFKATNHRWSFQFNRWCRFRCRFLSMNCINSPIWLMFFTGSFLWICWRWTSSFLWSKLFLWLSE